MIHNSHILYVASSSASRKHLLEQAKISFQVIDQHADESLISTQQPLHDVVMQIAHLKMQHVSIPIGLQGDVRFLLTADTLGVTAAGRVLCKPVDRADAVSMLHDARQGVVLTVTGFCVRKIQYIDGSWEVLQEILDYDQASSIFDVPDTWIDFYLDSIPFLSVSGAISIEGVGGQFLKSVDGSYETIVGLPMYKLRKALEHLGFYKN